MKVHDLSPNSHCNSARMVSRFSIWHWQVGAWEERGRMACTLTAVNLEAQGAGWSTSEAL